VQQRATPYGSILRASDGTYWYTCGSWRLASAADGIPSILAYAPEGRGFPHREGQKKLQLGGVTLLKISNQPLDAYTQVYLPTVSRVMVGPRFGRLVFLWEDAVVEVRDPRAFTRRFVDAVCPEGPLAAELLGLLGVEVEDAGVWGSSLMFDEPVRRHETDLVIYGRELSAKAYERFTGGAVPSEALELDPRLGLCTVFRYKGAPIDLFFDPNEREGHWLDRAAIRVVARLGDQCIRIADSSDGLFYPASYTCEGGKRLISFRPAHARRFFAPGARLRFDSLSLVEIVPLGGGAEEAYAVLDYETAEFL